MGAKNSKLAEDKIASERRKGLRDEQVKDLELAGGVEGGMKAGSAGGPGAKKQPAPASAGSKRNTTPNGTRALGAVIPVPKLRNR